MQVNEAHAQNMMAVSLAIGKTEVNGEDALAPKDDNWNIWDE